MEIFKSSPSEQLLTRAFVWGGCLGSLLFCGLILWQAYHFTNQSSTVRIGPLSLLQLEKTPLTPETYSLNFQFLPGLIMYFVLCFGICFIISLILHRRLLSSLF